MSESLEVNSQGGPETMSMMSGTGGGSGCDLTSQKSEPSPLSTPQTNKRVMTARKLRPKSVIDGGDGHAGEYIYIFFQPPVFFQTGFF